MDKDFEYWAANTDDIGAKLNDKVLQYFQFLDWSGRLDLYQKSYTAYFNPALKGSTVNIVGEQGELVQIAVNEYRALLKNLHTLITSARPAYECQTANTDHTSQAQAILGKSLVDYYLREKKLEFHLKMATELALAYAEGFVDVPWDAKIGDEIATDPETGIVIRNGDIRYRTLTPLEVIRDFSKVSPLDHHWCILVYWTNKYELAAQFPEHADTIIKLTDKISPFDSFWGLKQSREYIYGKYNTDEIPMFEFRHAPSDALPKGRLTRFLSDNTVLFDEAIPYPDIALYRVSAGEWLGTPFGYTVGFDLLPLQEMNDAIHSSICSNINAFSVQNVYCASGVNPSMIAGGLRLLEGQDRPEVLDLLTIPQELVNYGGTVVERMQAISNVNSVARGNPGRDMSGSAMALLQSTAIQYTADLQQSYSRLLEDCGTATLNRLRVFATVPRVAAIAGKSKKQYMQEFSGDDISLVNRVLVNVGNPIMNTTAGKMDLAEKLIQGGLINTPEQYIQVYTTGELEPLYEGLQSELMLIRGENEQISDGFVPPVLVTDNHPLHIKEHAVTGNSPDSRNDPKIMTAFTKHMQDHIVKWKGGIDPVTGEQVAPMDPDLAQMLGIPPPPNPMAAMMPPQPPPQQPQGSGNQNKPVPPNSPNVSQATTESGTKLPKKPKAPPGTPVENQAIIETMQ